MLALATLALPLLASTPQTTTLDGDVALAWSVASDVGLAADDAFADVQVVGGVAYCAGTAGGERWLAAAIDPSTGAELWRVDGTGPDGQAARAVTLAAVGGTLVLGGSIADDVPFASRGYLVGLDLATGAQVWSQVVGPSSDAVTTHETVLSMIEDVGGGDIVVLEHNQESNAFVGFDAQSVERLHRIDAATGVVAWSRSLSLVHDVKGIRVAPDGSHLALVAYRAVSQEFGGYTYTLLAERRSLANGDRIWQRPLETGVPFVDWIDRPSRALVYEPAGTQLFVAGFGFDALCSLDPFDGAPNWCFSTASFDVEHLTLDGGGDPVLGGLGSGRLRMERRSSVDGSLLAVGVGPYASQATDLAIVGGRALMSGFDTSFAGSDAWILGGFDLTSGALAWELSEDAGNESDDEAVALAATAGGDALVAGERFVSGGGGQARLERLDAGTGTTLTTVGVDVLLPSDQTVEDSALSADGSLVAVGGRRGLLVPGTFPFDAISGWVALHDGADGALLWSAGIEPVSSFPADVRSVHVDAASGTVLASGALDNGVAHVTAFDAATGAQLWSTPLDVLPTSTNTTTLEVQRVPGQNLVVAAIESNVEAGAVGLDLTTGALLWDTWLPGIDGNHRTRTALSPDGARLLVGASTYQFFGNQGDAALLSLDALTGAIQWSSTYDHTGQQESWDADFLKGLVMAPDGSAAYVTSQSTLDASGSGVGSVWTRVDPSDGGVVWQVAIPEGQPGAAFNLRRTAIAPDGATLFALATITDDFAVPFELWVQAVDAATGAELWAGRYPTGSTLQFNGYDLTVAPDGATVVVAASGGAQPAATGLTLGIETRAGAEVWRSELAEVAAADQATRAVLPTPDGRGVLVASQIAVDPAHRDHVLQRLELPFLTGAPQSLSVAAGGEQALALSGGVEQAGRIALLVGSLSGTTPGLPLAPGVELPLVVDAYTLLVAGAPGQPPLDGSLATLDAQGHADVTFALPTPGPAALAGATAHHAWLAIDPLLGPVLASNAVALSFTP